MDSFAAVLSALSMLAVAAPPAAAPAPPAPSASPSDNAGYIIGPEDAIEIEVVGQTDRARAHVYADGTIQLNLLGKVQAAGRTPRQLGDELAAAYKAGGYFANPVINVEVVSYSARYVTVLGDVASPGLVPINRPYRLSEIIARVNGLKPTAADYVVVRLEDGHEQRYSLHDMSTGDANQDPFVPAGAKVFSPPAELAYISGQVRAPGAFPLQSGMTIGQAIGRAGGLTDSGTDHGVIVTRGGKKLKFDAAAKVEAGDVIVVRERLF